MAKRSNGPSKEGPRRSQRKQAEEARRESEARFRSLFEQAWDIILLLELPPDGIPVIRDANPAASRCLGYEHDELLGQPVSFIDAEPQAQDLIKERRRGTLSGEMSVFEVKHRRKNGTVFEVECSVKEIQVGPKTFAFSIERDITERKRTAQALQGMQHLLNDVGRIAKIGGWSMDLATRKATWTQGTYDVVEIEPDQPAPGPDEHLNYYLPEYRPLVVEAMRALIEDDTPLEFEVQLRTAKGNVKWCRAMGRAIRKNGKAVEVYGTFQEITERKRAEEALKASEVRYRRLFEAARDGVLILDAETGMVVDVNPFLIKLLGYPREAFLGKTVWELGFLKDLFANQAKFTELQKNEYVRYEDLPLESADGRRIEVEFVSNVYLVDRHKVIQCNIRDISERKRAAETLHREQEFARTLLQNIGDGVVACNAQGTLVLFNRTAREWHGMDALALPPEEWGKHYDLYGPDGITPLPTESIPLVRTFRGETIHDVGMAIRAQGQPLRHILASGRPFFDAHHNLLGAVVVMRDITERRRAEEALHASEIRYRRLFESAKDGILILDAESGIVVDVNPFLLKVLGFSQEQLLGKKVWELGFLKDIAANQAKLTELQRKGYVRYEDMPLETADGRRVDVEFVSNVYMVNHQKVIQCNIRDITERKRLQEQFRQAQKMEAVGQLAGGVAHDFNNMLFVMNGRAEIALGRLAPDDPLRSHIELIKQSGERAANLTRQLLAFSRRQVLQPKLLDLNAVITDMGKMLLRLVREDIAIRMALDPAPKTALADPGQVEQILMNLVVNARDAMPQGGTVTIETAGVELDETYCRTHAEVKPGRYVLLALTDTGCGMDDNVKARIFEPFFTTKEQGQGTGLGLATVYGIVKQSGGHIAVYSEPGKGTTFKVYLPQVAATADAASGAALPAIQGGKETILLVEDDENVRSLAHDMLASSGYKVLLAGNGAEALAVCKKRKGKVDLIVTDVIMPTMNGPELADRVRRLQPGLRILFMSGYADHGMENQGVLGRDAHFLQKPFGPGALARKVREVLDTPPGNSSAGAPQEGKNA